MSLRVHRYFPKHRNSWVPAIIVYFHGEAVLTDSHLRCFLVSSILLFLVPHTQAAPVKWPVDRGPSHEPFPYKYNPKVWKKVPKEHVEDAPACVLYAATTHLMEPDGTLEEITHEISRLSSRKSIENFGEYRGITFHPRQQKVTLNLARVHKRDGTIRNVEPRHLRLRDVTTNYESYDPDKVLVISFPALEVGDVIEVKWTARGKNPEHDNEFFTRYNFGSLTYPIVRDELVVRVPKDKPFHHATVNGTLKPAITEDEKTRTYRWSTKHLPRLAQDEDRPASDELRLNVACSTFKNWQHVRAWKQKIRAGCWECAPEVKKLTHQITKDLKDPAAKARALTYWVRRHVRYLAAGEEHDYVPHPPAVVLANRRGDCKDTSQLLAVMLKEAGLPVALVTLGFRGDGQILKDVPSPWGTHGILLVTINGKHHWIDTTATLAKWDELPIAVRNRACYVTDDKDIRLMRTPPLKMDDYRIEQFTKVKVDFDYSTTISRESIYFGLAAMRQRDKWLEVPVGERRQNAAEKLQDNYQRAKLLKLDVDEKALWDFDGPVRGTETFEIARHFTGTDKPEAGFSHGKVWSFLLGYNVAHNRDVPLELYLPMELRHRFELTTPPGREFVSKPSDADVRSKWGTFTRTVRWGKDYRTLRIDTRLNLNRIRVEPKDFDEFRNFQQEVRKSYRAWLSIEDVRHLKYAADLESLLKEDSKHLDAAVSLAKSYVHHGKTGDARRVLDLALQHHPRSTALWDLIMSSETNPIERIKLQRRRIEVFPKDRLHVIEMASMLIDLGVHKKAQPLLRAVLPLVKDEVAALAHFHLGRSYAKEKNYKEALTHLGEAEKSFVKMKINPMALYLVLGETLERKGDVPEAIEVMQKALQLDPQGTEILTALIRLCRRAKEQDRASRYLRQYLVLIGDDFEKLIHGADLCLRMERYADARELAKRALKQSFHTDIQRILGLVALHEDDLNKALFHLDRAEPNSEVIAGLIHVHWRLGNLREVERQMAQVDLFSVPMTPALKQEIDLGKELLQRRDDLLNRIRFSKFTRSARMTQAGLVVCAEELLLRGGSNEQVLALLREASEYNLSMGAIQALEATLLAKQGQLRKSLTLADEAIRLTPNDPRGWHVRGLIRLERGEKPALADLEKAVTLSERKDAVMLWDLGEALDEAGRSREAVAAFQEALQLQFPTGLVPTPFR